MNESLEPSGMGRREFLQQLLLSGTVAGGCGLAGLKLWERTHVVPGFEEKEGLCLPSFAPEVSSVLPELAVARGREHGPTISAAIDALGGMKRFIRPNDTVLIKPNVAFDRPAALATTTHPDALRVVARLVFEAGARKILIADNPINSPAGCFLKSGLEAVAREMNLEIIYPTASAFSPLELDGDILRHWPMFYTPFQKADKVIGLAPCKDHNLSGASMTMKNWYGMLGGRRNQFHQHIHRIIADFALMVKPTLVILDGMNVLYSNGPTGGRLSDVKTVNTVVAGTDMVAVDSYGYRHLLGRDDPHPAYLDLAQARGLGNRDWERMRLKEVEA